MNTQDVANQLVSMCREGKYAEAVEGLYADNAASREMPGYPVEVTSGKDAIMAKNQAWFENVEEFHSGSISDPVVAGNHFSCKMEFDITFKDRGRTQMEELCVYEVNDEGKIVNEQFFYQM